jgi:pSer/pThr/pTyr-binding forkhead associated (FHA) protein
VQERDEHREFEYTVFLEDKRCVVCRVSNKHKLLPFILSSNGTFVNGEKIG